MRFKSSFVSATLAVLLVGLTTTAWIERQSVYDWLRLRNYQPSADIVQLAADTTMGEPARHLFYVNHAVIEDSNAFNQDCPDNGGEKTIVLGCYHSGQTGIFLYQVNDSRLSGVEQVTAAHETLHAIYERLSPKDRKYVDGLLQDFYEHDLKDKRLLSIVDSYRKSEPNDVVNEMHSVFGTEVRDLPPALEAYYARYFTDRKKIVSYSEQYEKAFSDRKAQADSYLVQINAIEDQLAGLKTEINNLETSLTDQYQALAQERQHTSDPAAFNAKVAAYNNQVNVYRNKVEAYNQLVKQHNDLLNKYKAVALEENELIKAIDSHQASVESQ